MEFKLIRNELNKEYDKIYSLEIQTEEDLKKALSSYEKSYKGDFEKQKEKLLKYVNQKKEKELNEELNFIESVENAEDFKSLTISIEWKKSKMWGANPTPYTDKGFIGSSIGGCGYCKHSTATAQALNSDLSLLKLLYAMEERRLKQKPTIPNRRAFIGYGSGSYALPKFDGGVGVSSHQSIIESLHLKWKHSISTDSNDVYTISN